MSWWWWLIEVFIYFDQISNWNCLSLCLSLNFYFPPSWAPQARSEAWEVYSWELYPPDDPPRPSRPKAGLGLVMIMMLMLMRKNRRRRRRINFVWFMLSNRWWRWHRWWQKYDRTGALHCAKPKGTLFSTVLAIVMTNLDSNKYRSEQSNYA